MLQGYQIRLAVHQKTLIDGERARRMRPNPVDARMINEGVLGQPCDQDDIMSS